MEFNNSNNNCSSNRLERRMSLSTLLTSSIETSSFTATNNTNITASNDKLQRITDRKVKNKRASAKYRAKKTTQYIEMQKINRALVLENAMLKSKLKNYTDTQHGIITTGLNQQPHHMDWRNNTCFKLYDRINSYSSSSNTSSTCSYFSSP